MLCVSSHQIYSCMLCMCVSVTQLATMAWSIWCQQLANPIELMTFTDWSMCLITYCIFCAYCSQKWSQFQTLRTLPYMFIQLMPCIDYSCDLVSYLHPQSFSLFSSRILILKSLFQHIYSIVKHLLAYLNSLGSKIL